MRRIFSPVAARSRKYTVFFPIIAMNILDPRVKSVWGIAAFIRTIFFSAALLIAEIVNASAGWFSLPVGAVSGGAFLLGITLIVFVPPLRYRFIRFDVRDDDIVVEHGILTRVRTIVPYRRVQHTDVSQGVIERSYGLSRLVIFTAGTRAAAAVIPGLPLDYAEELREHVRLFAADGDVL